MRVTASYIHNSTTTILIYGVIQYISPTLLLSLLPSSSYTEDPLLGSVEITLPVPISLSSLSIREEPNLESHGVVYVVIFIYLYEVAKLLRFQ
ncbi:hypothetical protein JOM56_015085 [Amanita muscaria]